MDKRYQVFVSSTYEDLREERQEIMHALLELGCIPSGMELFPAASEDQWTLIKKVIEECDYYLIVSAGRYGSIGSKGQSYTEMEYRYALDLGKPTVAFLHKDPLLLMAGKTEPTDEGKKLLNSLRDLLQKKMCKFWTSPAELGSVVSRSLVRLMSTTPAVGWVRSDQLIDAIAAPEILRLRKTIENLEVRLQQSNQSGPAGAEQLAQGSDTIELSFTFDSRDAEKEEWTWSYEINLSWNAIFYDLGPLMLSEISDAELKAALNRSVRVRSKNKRSSDVKFTGHTAQTRSFSVSDHDFHTVKIQLIALGLCTKSQKTRSLKDSRTFWALTPYGDQVLTRLRAVRRGPSLEAPPSSNDALES